MSGVLLQNLITFLSCENLFPIDDESTSHLCKCKFLGDSLQKNINRCQIW